MAFLYVVRCNFNRPDLERSWNDWYNGPKIQQLLSKPGFRAVQRFQLHSGSGRNYVAVWHVSSADAFKTPQYTSDWGFFEWERYVSDWSRDLFDAANIEPTALAISMNGFLRLLSFDGLDTTAAEAQWAVLAGASGMMWFKSVGLDRHTPLIGLRRTADATNAPSPPPGVQAGIYRPICEFTVAPSVM
jgi:hypothetical protein